MSELKIINGYKNLIICFGGMALLMDGIPPFEFLNYLGKVYKDKCDLIFFIDKNQCWYHKGIDGITKNIDETINYLNSQINNYKYSKIIFMGTSAGGYASILFGSLCNKVNYVISFVPQTIIKHPVDVKYSNLKNIINNKTNYILYGDTKILDKNNSHHISHCENIENFPNIKIIRQNGINLKELRDNGTIQKILDDIIH